MSKFCLYCEKQLRQDQRHNKYCSVDCANKARSENKIQLWLAGEYDGVIGTN